METRSAPRLGFLLIFFFLTMIEASVFTIKNNCAYTIWPATLTGAGHSQLSSSGFELTPGASRDIAVPSQWSGRVWARTYCSTDASGRFQCLTGDCGSGTIECKGAGGAPPASLVELTLTGYQGQDFYDVSLVDGFNLPVSVTPRGGSGSACTVTSCANNVNTVCAPELALKGADGGVIGCKSACEAIRTTEYCCTGEHGTPDKCPPTAYSKIFKNQCPQAYSYAYDDKTSTFTCNTGANYLFTFCP